MKSIDKVNGIILEIQRMSTEDGPGIRSTLFLKGCTLKCKWCHNPESIAIEPEIQWLHPGCIGCGYCLLACPNEALIHTNNRVSINRERCKGCGKCANACPSGSIDILGKRVTSHSIVKELIKDRAYFEKSGGGVTISGGEVTMQSDFSLEILKGLKAEGIETAIDTCGFCSWDNLAKLLPYSDLVLYDLKEIDSNKHKIFTDAPNETILENLIKLVNYKKTNSSPKHIWIRTPIIPDATDTVDNIKGIAEFLLKDLPLLPDRWELCAFNNLCNDKYERLGLTWEYKNKALLAEDYLIKLVNTAKDAGIPDSVISWSGTSRQSENKDNYEQSEPVIKKNFC